MEYVDYIVLNIGKIVIKYEDGVRQFYKNEVGELVDLTVDEFYYVDQLFQVDQIDVCYSEKLNMVLSENNELEYKDEILLPLLEFLDGVIPQDCKHYFYHNLSTLKIKYHFGSNFLDEEMVDIRFLQMGSYNVIENEIEVTKDGLKFIWEYFQGESDFRKLFGNEVGVVLLHELCHMASSHYDKESNMIMCGFDVYSASDDFETLHRGLTEGMTEFISHLGISSKVPSQYYVELLFVNQLCQIVGRDLMFESYFKHLGTKKIEEFLSGLDFREDSFKYAQQFFIRFEDNYQLRHQNIKQSLLANIQSSLIHYYRCKLNHDIHCNHMSFQSIMESLQSFEQSLVVPERLLGMKRDPNNYIGLERALKEFYDFKESILKNYGLKNYEQNKII